MNVVSCLYLDNNCLISFFILCLVENSICLIIEPFLLLRLLSTVFIKTKVIRLGLVIVTNLLSSKNNPITLLFL